MFTGLIQDIGHIKSIVKNASGVEFTIVTNLADQIKVDDSIATNGVCLTATKVTTNSFTCQAVPVTLSKSSLGELKVNDPVNLELALRYADRLGGHMVQGHVSGVGEVKSIQVQGETWKFELTYPQELARYMILEGSIAIEGVSLTIAAINQKSLTIALIPHTLNKTILGKKNVGDRVNIEVDMVAKYVEKLLSAHQSKTTSLPFRPHYED
jgi:riboflavin synthase